jgi:hypothetical protein
MGGKYRISLLNLVSRGPFLCWQHPSLLEIPPKAKRNSHPFERANAGKEGNAASSSRAHGGVDRYLERMRLSAGAIREFRGMDSQPHLLFQRAAQEATHGVSLPAGDLLELLQRSAFWTF